MTHHWLSLIPNSLSASRIVLALIFPFVSGEWRLGIVIAAAGSDMIDGLVARWLHAESDVGRLLDPVADKFFILLLAGTLLVEGELHPLWALGLAVRDITVLIGLLYMIARRQWKRGRRLRPSFLGKSTTAAQFVVVLVIVILGHAPVWLLATITVLSIAAAIDYFITFRQLRFIVQTTNQQSS